MNNISFYQTAMGRDFFDRNIPALIKQLTRLNDNLVRLIELLENRNKSPE